jgi:hypothetical protein
MGKLKYPFIAGAAALCILSLLLAPDLFPKYDEGFQVICGAIVGLLSSVVLYAVMRAIAAR